MNTKFSAVSLFFVMFAFIFYFFSTIYFGNAMFSTKTVTAIQSAFSTGTITASINSVIGSASSWGFFGGLHQLFVYVLTPFAYIYYAFTTLGLIVVFIGYFLNYPFSFFPSPLNVLIPTFLIIFLVVSLLTSIRVMESGIE